MPAFHYSCTTVNSNMYDLRFTSVA